MTMNVRETVDVFAATILENTVQHYDWGSTTAIPDLLGATPDGRPAAELWLGAHPSAPSRLCPPGGGGVVSLADMVGCDPVRTLGPRVVRDFGPRLPFLLKVLAADRPLSLQVHPDAARARRGYQEENRTGPAVGHPTRSFHDDQHKPEMLVALTPFEGLAGFRSPRAVRALLDGLEGDLVRRMRAALDGRAPADAMRAATALLVGTRTEDSCSAELDRAVASVARRYEAGSPSARADATVLHLAEQHPGDPGALVSLLLNRVTLEPGEAMFVPAGEVHAYLSGVGVEVMAASDNVLRAGLTSKHVDAPALLECAGFAPRPPGRPETTVTGSGSVVTTHRAPATEFALTLTELAPDDPVGLLSDGPRIVLVLDGHVRLLTGSGELELHQGQSSFVPHAAGPVTVDGTGHVVCAWVP
ncbi:mannose-6-phosphate isomerase, class I [Isoptericola aurantiacus]|uniref:mannose-6-phosphate isomerase, class I n=1 Tax=Isoptericola aurantiacus TaxID=3377839 RepID=UPI00383B2367